MANGNQYRFNMGIRFLVFTILGWSFIACSPVHRGPANRTSRISGGNGGLTSSAAAFETSLYPIIQTNCAACHGAGQQPEFAISDVQNSNDALLQWGLVDLENPANSTIVNKIRNGHTNVTPGLNDFPVTLADEIQTAIELWAVTAGDDGGVIVALVPTFESLYNRIFISRCNNCHSGGAPAGGLDLTDRDLAVAGGNNGGFNGALTPLYVRVTDPNAGTLMPQGGTELSDEEKQTILDWINAGGPLN